MTNKRNILIQKEICNVLHYFNFFKFPLTLEEMYSFIKTECTVTELQLNIITLLENKSIFEIDNCYLLESNTKIVERKREGKKNAENRMKRARKIARFIGAFPFVKSVSVSGSLSKGYADKKTDIDFFIITSEHNLWTSRTLLHIFKKTTFLFNMQHSFCMNYFIAESHLNIEEKNYFTAIEIKTLIPLYGENYYNKLISENDWIFNLLPNNHIELTIFKKNSSKIFKKTVEFFLKSKRLNDFCMNFTDKKWQRKWIKKGISKEEYKLAFKTKKYVSKNHPKNYQKLILDQYSKNKEDE